MGGTSWSDDHYQQRSAQRAASGTPVFAYHTATAAKPANQQCAHPSLDPKGLKIRESRDSAAHPESNAVAVFFDVTGSMGEVPGILQAGLKSLMGLLLRKSYLTDPAILVGAIGDANTDNVPLQVGQFESGIEIENDLTNLFLEGNGGGQVHESYEIGLFVVARHTAIDCWEKRQKKGYCFLVGDEMPYDLVERRHVSRLIGDGLEGDIPVKDIIAEVQQRYELFYILPRMTSYYDDAKVNDRWRELLGERFLKLEDPSAISELIASTIGLCERNVDRVGLADDLAASGLSKRGVDAVTTALAKVGDAAAAGAVTKVPAGSGLVSV